MWYHSSVSRWTKLLERIRKKRANVQFSDLEGLLRRVGFELDRQVGGHRIFRHAAHPARNITLQPAKDGKAKPYQVKQVVQTIDDLRLSVDSDKDGEEDE